MNCFKFLWLVLLFAAGDSFAQSSFPPAFEITSDTILYEELDGDHWQMLEDPTDALTLHEVSGSGLSSKFHDGRIVDYSIHTFWVRFRLKNMMPREAKISFNEPYCDYADVYLSHDSAGWEKKSFGRLYPWNKK